MRRFPKALRPVENLNDEAARERSRATRGALGATHLEHPFLSKIDDRAVLLYTEAAAAHTPDRKQNATFKGLIFHPCAALLL